MAKRRYQVQFEYVEPHGLTICVVPRGEDELRLFPYQAVGLYLYLCNLLNDFPELSPSGIFQNLEEYGLNASSTVAKTGGGRRAIEQRIDREFERNAFRARRFSSERTLTGPRQVLRARIYGHWPREPGLISRKGSHTYGALDQTR